MGLSQVKQNVTWSMLRKVLDSRVEIMSAQQDAVFVRAFLPLIPIFSSEPCTWMLAQL